MWFCGFGFFCSMDVGDHKHSDLVWFYQLGLGAANTVNVDGWKLETLGSILSKAHQLNVSNQF